MGNGAFEPGDGLALGRCVQALANVSDSIGPLNQCPRGQRILALSSAPSVEFIRYRSCTSAGSPHRTEPVLSI